MCEVRLIADYSDSDESDNEVEEAKPSALEESVEAFMKEINELDKGPAKVCVEALSEAKSEENCQFEWQELIDATTGYPYYWNVKTEDITWEPPPKFNPYKAFVAGTTTATSPQSKAQKRPPEAEREQHIPKKTRKTEFSTDSSSPIMPEATPKAMTSCRDQESSQDSLISKDEEEDLILERLKQRSKLLQELGGKIPDSVQSLFDANYDSDDDDVQDESKPPHLPSDQRKNHNLNSLPLLCGPEERESFAFDLSSLPLSETLGHRVQQRGLGYHENEDDSKASSSKNEKFISFVKGDTISCTKTEQTVVVEPLYSNNHDKPMGNYIIQLSKILHSVSLPELTFLQQTKIQLEVLVDCYRQGVLDAGHFSTWLSHTVDKLSDNENYRTCNTISSVEEPNEGMELKVYGPEPFLEKDVEVKVESAPIIDKKTVLSPSTAVPLENELSNFYSDLATLGVYENAAQTSEDVKEEPVKEGLSQVAVAEVSEKAEEPVVKKPSKKAEKLKIGSSVKSKKKGEVDTLVAKWKKAREELLK